LWGDNIGECLLEREVEYHFGKRLLVAGEFCFKGLNLGLCAHFKGRAFKNFSIVPSTRCEAVIFFHCFLAMVLKQQGEIIPFPAGAIFFNRSLLMTREEEENIDSLSVLL
jgi:hypothetical protein